MAASKNKPDPRGVVKEFLDNARASSKQKPPKNNIGKTQGQSDSPAMTLETITPAIAKSMLELNINNRPLSERGVDNLVHALTSGQWINELGDPIRFDVDGFLLDGQHRLAAVIRSGCSIRSYVLRGLPSDAFAYIDRGKSRSNSNILACAHTYAYATVASALRLIARYQISFAALRMESWEVLEMLKAYPEIEDVARQFMNMKIRGSIVTSPVAVGLKTLTDRINKEESDLFWHRLLIGDGISTDDPEFSIRRKLIEARTTTKTAKRLSQEETAVFIIKAWNARRENRNLTVFRWDDRTVVPALV